MSTRSSIARENENGTYDVIYCHWDGYPENNGKLLLQHYTDPDKVDTLLSLGNVSSLDAEIGEKHDFNDAPEGQTNFYGRDRGETGNEAARNLTLDEFKAYLADSWTEWVYIFKVPENKWYFTNNPSPTWIKMCGSEQLPIQPLTLEDCGIGGKAEAAV